MNKFFKTFLAALLAFIAGTVLVWMLVLMIFSGIAGAFSTKQVAVVPESVLHIDLRSSIVDSPNNKIPSVDFSSFEVSVPVTVHEMAKAIEYAAADNNIKGIYINLTGTGSAGNAQVEELRAHLEKFKQSGKFVVGYQNSFAQGSYYLASVADEVYMNPAGTFDWRGLSATVMFYKGLLDKLDVKMEIFRHGTFKSAVEPYMTDRMSDANRFQMSTMVNSMWSTIVEAVSASRDIPQETLKKYADELAVRSPSDAVSFGLVDDLLYEDQVMNILYDKIHGKNEDAQVNKTNYPKLVSLGDYVASTVYSGRKLSKNRIAVIYADGDIADGLSSPGVVGSQSAMKQLSEARADESIKGVVFRVNSPGGSALASEEMWREVELLQKEKPVIVSMGSYAASGGYYIACAADVIMADRITLTGSIGVFGMAPNIEKTLENKLGITVDGVKTGPSGDMGSILRTVTPAERSYFMSHIENTYNTFVTRVADGRNVSFEQVDKIAEGRVWSGVDAKEIGLVDGFGGLADAINLAADRAGVAGDYMVYEIVDTPRDFSNLFTAMWGMRQTKLQDELGEAFKQYNNILKTVEGSAIQARLPYVVEIQ